MPNKRWLIVIAIGVTIALIIIIFVPHFQIPAGVVDAKGRAELENSFRATLATIFGGLAFVITAYMLWRQIHTSEEGQITERFSKAIEQLGSDKTAVVLGGIYALERIASDSKKDHRQVMEVLTAYVRENAPWRSYPSVPQPEVPALDRNYSTPVTIQAIMTVLGRRKVEYEDRTDDSQRLDLSNTDLYKIRLEAGAHFKRAILRGANLSKADLKDTHLEGADLTESHLEEANLRGVHLEGAYLLEANLEGAGLVHAYLQGANLRGVHLEGADLQGVHLERANLTYAHFLEGVYLGDAHLEGASLRGVHLEEAYLGNAHLDGANLQDVHLERAYLGDAHLDGANLRDANLAAVDLRKTQGLAREQLDEAIWDETTILPDYLQGKVQPPPTSSPA